MTRVDASDPPAVTIDGVDVSSFVRSMDRRPDSGEVSVELFAPVSPEDRFGLSVEAFASGEVVSEIVVPRIWEAGDVVEFEVEMPDGGRVRRPYRCSAVDDSDPSDPVYSFEPLEEPAS